MSRYEERLANDKSELRRNVAALGACVADAVDASVTALLAGDHPRSYRIMLEDLPINRESRRIDKACHAFVARHLPSAGHLRFVSSVMRMSVELERVGDYAVSISRQAVQLSVAPSGQLAEQMKGLADQSTTMLRDALAAFDTRDEELARETKPRAVAVEQQHTHIFQDLTADTSRSVRDIAGLLVVFNKLERVSDQAKNICEETLFELLGETKPPKRYRVLFVDRRNSVLAPLALLLARKAFPESGQFDCAGSQPANAIAPELSALATELGIDTGDVSPTKLDPKRLSKYHVVVWLTGEPRDVVEHMPYQTALLRWELPNIADDRGDVADGLRGVARVLSAEIRDLMVTLRGEDAS